MARAVGYPELTIVGFKGLRHPWSVDGAPDEAIAANNIVITPEGDVRTRPRIDVGDGAGNTYINNTDKFVWSDLLDDFFFSDFGTNRTVFRANGSGDTFAQAFTDYTEFDDKVYFLSGTNIPFRYITGAFQSMAGFCGSISPITGALTAGLTLPRGNYCARLHTDDRFVIAGGNSLVADGPLKDAAGVFIYLDGDMVCFSEPGRPDIFRADSWVRVGVGDGEDIMGVATWGDTVFVFKESRFFTFRVGRAGPNGVPIFDYRTIDTGISARWGGAVVAPEGVYFLSDDGIYRTTGGAPVSVAPFWSELAQLLESNYGFYGWRLVYVAGRLYVFDKFNATRMVYVHDLREGWFASWTLFADTSVYQPMDIGIGKLSNPATDPMALCICHTNSAGTSTTMVGGLTEDGSTVDGDLPFSALYASGYATLGKGLVRVRQSELWGRGLVDFGLWPDYQVMSDAQKQRVDMGSNVGWGGVNQPNAAYGSRLARRAARGNRMAFRVSNVGSGAFQLHQLGYHLAGERGSGDGQINA